MQCSPKVPQQVTNYSVAPTGFPHMQDGYGVSLQVEVLNKVQLVTEAYSGRVLLRCYFMWRRLLLLFPLASSGVAWPLPR